MLFYIMERIWHPAKGSNTRRLTISIKKMLGSILRIVESWIIISDRYYYKNGDMYARSNLINIEYGQLRNTMYKEEILNDFIGLNDAERSTGYIILRNCPSHMIRYCNLGTKLWPLSHLCFSRGFV